MVRHSIHPNQRDSLHYGADLFSRDMASHTGSGGRVTHPRDSHRPFEPTGNSDCQAVRRPPSAVATDPDTAAETTPIPTRRAPYRATSAMAAAPWRTRA